MAWSQVELQTESLPRTVAELPLPDLKALETRKAMLCSFPGHLPPGGWLTQSWQGEGLREWTEPGIESTEWAFWKVLGPNSSSVKGTKGPDLGHSGKARLAGSSVTNYPGPPGSEGVPGTFSFKIEMNWSYGEGGMWAGWVCGAV